MRAYGREGYGHRVKPAISTCLCLRMVGARFVYSSHSVLVGREINLHPQAIVLF